MAGGLGPSQGCHRHPTASLGQEAKQAENTCGLGDLPEGQLGKLLIRKSGKVQLVLGKVTLDVTMGTPCSFLQVWGEGREGPALGAAAHDSALGVPGEVELALGEPIPVTAVGRGPAAPTLGPSLGRGKGPRPLAQVSRVADRWFGFFPPPPLEKELVSVSIGDNRTGEMIVLGHVKHKLVCSPDFEALLEHRHR